jgi:hypothetical protein
MAGEKVIYAYFHSKSRKILDGALLWSGMIPGSGFRVLADGQRAGQKPKLGAAGGSRRKKPC